MCRVFFCGPGYGLSWYMTHWRLNQCVFCCCKVECYINIIYSLLVDVAFEFFCILSLLIFSSCSTDFWERSVHVFFWGLLMTKTKKIYNHNFWENHLFLPVLCLSSNLTLASCQALHVRARSLKTSSWLTVLSRGISTEYLLDVRRF